ncbi:MAG: WD40 repeat domain-containing protein [Gemmataceae bacterium]|nr:WD40 repeat domain-containing protein [Gemmataceae bacterium]
MGRFWLTVILALGIGTVIAWGFGLGPFAKVPREVHAEVPQPARDWGEPLFGPLKAPAAVVIEDQPSAWPRARRELVIAEASVHPIDKQEISAGRDGILLFVGERVYAEDPLATSALPTASILYGGAPLTMTYRPWKQGDYVEYDQMLALVDPTKAMNELLYKKAKVKAAEANYQAAIATANEAEARMARARRLEKVLPEEEVSAAVLTHVKYRQEEIAKKEEVRLAEVEELQAVADLRQHEVRNKMRGKGIVGIVYRQLNEGVKNLEPVLQVYSVSRLRVEGLLEAQYADQLKDPSKMRVIVEPIHEMAPERLPLGSKAHRGEVNSVAFSHSPRGPLFVSGSEDRTVGVWKLAGGEAPEVLHHETAVRVVACSPPVAGRRICLAGCADGKVYVWDLDKLDAPLHKIEAHRDAITALAFSPDGKFVASGGQDNALCLWEVQTGKLLYTFDHEHGVDNPHQGTVTALHFTPQGKLVSAGRDNTLRVWALHEKGPRLEGEPVFNRGGSVTHPGVSADGKLMVFDQGRTLQLLSVEKHRPMAVLKNQATATPFETIALFSPDSSLLLTAGANEGRMQLWRTPTATSRAYEVRQLVPTERSAVTSAAFSPDGRLAVSGTKDGYVHLWIMPTAKQLQEHRIRLDPQQQPLRLANVDRALDGSKMRVTLHLDNPETPEFRDGRLRPGNRVTLVIEEP